MSSSSSSKIFELEASNGELFRVEEAMVLQSETIKRMIEDDCANTTIPLPNVTSETIAKVIMYCRKHETPKNRKRILKSFDADFVNVDQDTLFELVLAAKYLNIKSMLDLTCQAVADTIKRKTPEEVRTMFNINSSRRKRRCCEG